jgi:hypothetical protein
MKKKKMIKKLKRVIWAEHSWMCASELCRKAATLTDRTVNLDHAIFTGIACSYARPFTENTGLGSITVDSEFENFSENPRCEAIHDEIMEFRQSLFAHQDEKWASEKMGDQKVYKLHITDREAEAGHKTYFTRMSGVALSSFDEILELLEYQKAKAITVKNKILTDLEAGELEIGEYEITECFHPVPKP